MEMIEEYIDCRFIKLIHESVSKFNPNNKWRIAIYEDRNGTSFSAKGSNLPDNKSLMARLYGTWEEASQPKYKPTFNVAYVETLFPETEKGFVQYMSSLKIGIGATRAKAIFNKFGEKVWDVIEKDPEALLSVKGIRPKTVQRLSEKIADTLVERQLIHLFTGSINVKPKHIKSVKLRFGEKNIMEQISVNPYALTELNGFSFQEVDKLAEKRFQIRRNDPRRIEAAAKYRLSELSASVGDVCSPKDDLVESLFSDILNDEETVDVSQNEIEKVINTLCREKKLFHSNGMVYLKKNYIEEVGIVNEIKRLTTKKEKQIKEEKIEKLLSAYERTQSFQFAEQQKLAIISVMQNPFSVVTGGPGTGKSTVLRAALWVYNKLYSGKLTPVLMAPTGKAARRMTEATGYDATTIHSAIGYKGDEECEAEGILKGDLFVIDESSMVDQHIAYVLLKKIPYGAKVVMVGDPDQLPSIGCGNFLEDLILSKSIPTVRLNVIFRQKEGNPIIENAAKIREGVTNLNLSQGRFSVIKEHDSESLFRRACSLYLKCVERYGIENVILLNALRSKSELNVNRFNKVIQANYNPPKPGEVTMTNGTMTFRKNDRVMQKRNTEEAKNGDVGTIRDLFLDVDPDDPEEKEPVALIEFEEDGVLRRYTADMMRDIDLAYSTTVHKSQGSQYQNVILVVSSQHKRSNNRSIIYTGITRSSENLLLLTEDQRNNAIDQAISKMPTKRHTLLAPRLYMAAKC